MSYKVLNVIFIVIGAALGIYHAEVGILQSIAIILLLAWVAALFKVNEEMANVIRNICD